MAVVNMVTQIEMAKYLNLTSEVFSNMKLEKIKKNAGMFNKNTKFYVLEKKQKYISVLFLHPITLNGFCFGGIGGVATKKKYRNQGYASYLINKVIEDSAECYDTLFLWTRVGSFFERLGFRDVSDYFNEDANGSKPMMYSLKPMSNICSPEGAKLPRQYF